jgi:hypothetical protein
MEYTEYPKVIFPFCVLSRCSFIANRDLLPKEVISSRDAMLYIDKNAVSTVDVSDSGDVTLHIYMYIYMYVACMGEVRNAYKFLVTKPEGNRLRGC